MILIISIGSYRNHVYVKQTEDTQTYWIGHSESSLLSEGHVTVPTGYECVRSSQMTQNPIHQLAQISEIFAFINGAVEAQGGTYEDFVRFLNNSVHRHSLGRLVMGTLEVVPTQYPVTVDYSMSLQEMVEAANFDIYPDRNVNETNYLVTGQGAGSVVLELFHMGKQAYTPDVLVELDKRGLRPATIEELLAFAVFYPQIHVELGFIVSLAHSFQSSRGVSFFPALILLGYPKRAIMAQGVDGRDEGGWESNACFLVARK